MKQYVFSVFDDAIKAFAQPFFQPTDAAAIRLFQSQANMKDSIIFQHPDQFTLFKIGEYDDKTGIVTSFSPSSLGNARQYKDVSQEISFPEFEKLMVRIKDDLERMIMQDKMQRNAA